MKMKMSELDWAAWIFVIIGALSWGLVGLFKFDVVQVIFSTAPLLGRVIYVLVGASGLYWLVKLFKMER